MLDENVTRRSFAAKARAIRVFLSVVALLTVCVARLVTSEPPYDVWTYVAGMVPIVVLVTWVWWALRSGLLGRMMAVVRRTRPKDPEKERRA